MRPGVLEFLNKTSKDFDLYVFTAATKEYADLVLDTLDPGKVLFHRRLYRTECSRTRQGYYTKDLRKITSNLERVVLVDNNPICFVPQPTNGIWIPSFYDDHHDRALYWLMDVLNDLKNAFDVRPLLDRQIRLQVFKHSQIERASDVPMYPVFQLRRGGGLQQSTTEESSTADCAITDASSPNSRL